MTTPFAWTKRCAYDEDHKRVFHRTALNRLKALATELHWPPCSYDLRTNKGGIAVSGEITLHHEHVYIQISQPASGADTGILLRTCCGRRDYCGGPNTHAPLALLDDIPALARRVTALIARKKREAA